VGDPLVLQALDEEFCSTPRSLSHGTERTESRRAARGDRMQRSRLLRAILDEVRAERVAPLVGQTFPLARAEKAHLAMEARETVAKSLLVPD
jgi:NADPH:quinone reductase-like Zn-dependent oxidoreductase